MIVKDLTPGMIFLGKHLDRIELILSIAPLDNHYVTISVLYTEMLADDDSETNIIEANLITNAEYYSPGYWRLISP